MDAIGAALPACKRTRAGPVARIAVAKAGSRGAHWRTRGRLQEGGQAARSAQVTLDLAYVVHTWREISPEHSAHGCWSKGP